MLIRLLLLHLLLTPFGAKATSFSFPADQKPELSLSQAQEIATKFLVKYNFLGHSELHRASLSGLGLGDASGVWNLHYHRTDDQSLLIKVRFPMNECIVGFDKKNTRYRRNGSLINDPPNTEPQDIYIDPSKREKPIPIPKSISNAAYCIAYEFRDPDQRDIRYLLANAFPDQATAEDDPFLDNPNQLEGSREIITNNGIDVATLSTQKTGHKFLDRETTARLLKATFNGQKQHPRSACYSPHHIFVFYSLSGIPVSAIEVCLSCSQLTIMPDTSYTGSWNGHYETADLEAIAKILTDNGLGLAKYKSFEEYRAGLQAAQNRKRTTPNPDK